MFGIQNPLTYFAKLFPFQWRWDSAWDALESHVVTKQHFSASAISLRGLRKRKLFPSALVKLDGFGEDVAVTEGDLAILSMAPNGATLELTISKGKHYGQPPGFHLTVHHDAIGPGHANNVVWYETVDGRHGLYVDHIFFDNPSFSKPRHFGTIAAARMIFTAYRLGFDELTLLAGGSKKFADRWTWPMNGYRFWPSLGFNAPVHPTEIQGIPKLQQCVTVLDIKEVSPEWWRDCGDGRDMQFDLTKGSVSWEVLFQTLRRKGLA